MRGKLNIFQRTMLQWNGLHPYNAVHVVRVPQPLEMNRLRFMINSEMEQFGLTGFSLDKRKGAFQYQGGPVQNEIRMIPVDQGPQAALQKEVEAVCETSGFPPENRAFQPHLTLGRVKGKRNLQPLVDCIKLGSALERSFKADHFNIYRSILKPQGAVYTVLQTIALREMG